MPRRVAPDEAEAWARVRATVRPLHRGKVASPIEVTLSLAPEQPRHTLVAADRVSVSKSPVRARATVAGGTLDGGWDKRISRGALSPDRTIDLHGHTLSAAHARLDLELDRAVGQGDRVVLLVTGRPPKPESERPHARGAIRAAVADWLALSRHAGAIAAVRTAHPRHGGAGALYVVLRRPRR